VVCADCNNLETEPGDSSMHGNLRESWRPARHRSLLEGEPKDDTRPKGAFALWVANWSGLRELDIHLIRGTGERAQKRQISKGRYGLSYHDLTQGQYLLTNANHPNRVCRITSTAR
jgi:hypothetical protein